MAVTRGPVPKRSSQRRRANAPEVEVTKAAGAANVPVPEAEEGWHPIARAWFESLAESGQAVFYEPSDWAAAVLIAESLSRDLKPQVVGVTEEGDPVLAVIPLKGASLSSYLKAFSVLLTTEGDRRRARVELERMAADEEETGDVSELDEYRRRLKSS